MVFPDTVESTVETGVGTHIDILSLGHLPVADKQPGEATREAEVGRKKRRDLGEIVIS